MKIEKYIAHFVSPAIAVTSLSLRLFKRTIGAKYRKSFLGYFWMVAPALFITGGVTLASHAGILAPGDTILPYPLFVFLGTLLWQVFAEAVDVGHQAFEGARSYITRVSFPHAAIILAQLYESLITAVIRLTLVLALAATFHGLDLLAIVWVSACFCGALLLGVGIGLLLMPFTLLFADLHHTLKLALTYGLFLTPAMYVPKGDNLFALIVNGNPLSLLMQGAREAVAGLPLTQSANVLILVGIAIALSLSGFVLVRAVAPIVLERMLMGGR
jgi:lipopolysaccharide transport system permease protein